MVANNCSRTKLKALAPVTMVPYASCAITTSQTPPKNGIKGLLFLMKLRYPDRPDQVTPPFFFHLRITAKAFERNLPLAPPPAM
ncbi:hypothetical protein [Pseudomonas sp. EpS/L25]|uniref:hypothetical protein n=1 Tax=Pseudomonas sp. EpS/L25 TaxID=1749078 RepID=UPI0015A7437D|nr:hypothetical protein [Pseudomonas sp. EpS/L25]